MLYHLPTRSRLLLASILIGSIAGPLQAAKTNTRALPVRWAPRPGITSTNDMLRMIAGPLPVPKDQPLILSAMDAKGEVVSNIEVTTGTEYLSRRRQGYFPYSTYELSTDAWALFSVGTYDIILHAQPSATSYVADIALDRLHATDRRLLEDIPQPKRKGLSYDLTVVSNSDTEIWSVLTVGTNALLIQSQRLTPRYEATPYRLVGTTDDDEDLYDLVAWGDFNGDGIEDLLLERSHVSLQGSGRSYSHLYLTRLKPRSRLVEIKPSYDWLTTDETPCSSRLTSN